MARRLPQNYIDFSIEQAKAALSDWIWAYADAAGSDGIMWDPETDELTLSAIVGYRALPASQKVEIALQSGVAVKEDLIEASINEYRNGGRPPAPAVFEFLARRGRGKVQVGAGAPRGQGQANAEIQTRSDVQAVRWYFVHKLGRSRSDAQVLAIEHVAEKRQMDPRTVKTHYDKSS